MTNPNPPSPLARAHRPMRIVLVGSSLAEESDGIVRAGLAVARAAGARLLLVHAAPDEPRMVGLETGLAEDYFRERFRQLAGKLREQIERLGIGDPELAGAEVAAGAPHRVLVEAARTAGADLMVVGATGSGPLAAELLGSTAERVARKAACPVLLVRGELPVPPRRVLAPVDLSSVSGDAFRCGMHLLAQLAKDGEIEVRAVYALSFLEGLALQRRDEELISRDEAERGAAEALRRFVLENRPDPSLRVETAVLPGEARFEILDVLKERAADLVVLGTHGRGGLDRLMLGSVAATVARKAPCSVLLISPEAALEEGIADAVTAQTAPAWHRERPPAG